MNHIEEDFIRDARREGTQSVSFKKKHFQS